MLVFPGAAAMEFCLAPDRRSGAKHDLAASKHLFCGKIEKLAAVASRPISGASGMLSSGKAEASTEIAGITCAEDKSSATPRPNRAARMKRVPEPGMSGRL